MRMHKWVFLVAYVIYMLFAIVFTIVSNKSEIIDTLIFSVTIASTFFSISDLIFTKLDIDRKESDELFTLLFLSQYAQKIYLKKIEVKYGKDAEIKLSELKKILGEEAFEKIVSSNLSKEEKENYLKQVNDIKLKKFLNELIQTNDEQEIVEVEDERSVVDVLKSVKRREKFYFSLPSIVAVIGLVSLIVILTLRVEPQPKINNVCTLVAFLSVITNLLLKECYKDKSLKQLADERREIIKDIKENE